MISIYTVFLFCKYIKKSANVKNSRKKSKKNNSGEQENSR